MFLTEIAAVPQTVPTTSGAASAGRHSPPPVERMTASEGRPVDTTEEASLKKVFAHIYGGLIKESLTSESLLDSDSELSLQDEYIYDQYAEIIAEKMVDRMNLSNLMATRSFE